MNFRISHPFEPGDKGGDEAARKEDPAKVRARVDEPIAIVGIACRFPGGATSPDRFWQLLWEGVDAIREVPADRWDIDAFYDPDRTAPGKMSTRWGGFLEGGVDGFDPGFFGISPREAVEMDPQQRLMLELAWEGFEDAGVDPASLRGSPVGVFAGAMWTEYARSVEGGAELISQHTATGQDSSIIPARISYTFGLSGPSLTVNTAASSSLVAIELACQSVRSGVSAAALAGGVNLILAPHSTVAMSKFGAMAPDGRCKAFDARANGYVRGEGGGLVLLKPLSRALEDGDRIYCVIRGGALNNDGASSSLTAPSPEAQEAMLRAACANAGIEPDEVSYVEAHGTGTKVGDPIEAGALGAVIGAARKKGKGPLRVGSVKTNIGHLEAAAGVAGLIKVALSMDRGAIPASLHFETPNPSIDFEGLGVLVSARRGPWPEGRRVAGVSSFGFGGTNCHLVVEEAPRIAVRACEEQVDRPLHVVAISGHDRGALLDRAQALRGHLEADSSRSLADVGYSANARRGHLRERLAVVAGDAGEAAEALGVFLGGEGDARVIEGPQEGLDRPPRVAFVFPGQGPQHAGMGRELYETQPVFREALDRCAAILKDLLPRPILPVMHPEEGDDPSIIDDTRYTQPALFAMGYALVELWRSWGIEPAAVLGHSMGELTAAHVAGVFSLEDGLKLAVARGHWMNEMPAGGRMVFVRASERRVAELVAPLADKVAIAAINGPEHTVVSGAGEAVGVIVEALRAEGVETTEIRVSLASHSPLVAPVADAYGEAIKGILYGPPKLPLISNVTGAQADVRVAAPGYWVDHLRLPVRFGDGMAALNALGIDAVIEMSPHPVLLGMGREAGRAEGVRLWLPSLRRGSPDWSILLKSAATLYTHGARIDWRAFDAPYARRLVDLPAYPFQRERFWLNGGRVRAWAGGAVPEAEGRGAAPSGTTKKRSETLAEKLAKVEPEKRRDWVEQVIRAAAGKVVGLAAARIRTDRPWRELGLDSLMASELRGAVALLLGKSVPSTLMFDHPTVLSLTGYVLREVESLPAPEIVAESAPVSVPVSAPAPVSAAPVPVSAPAPVATQAPVAAPTPTRSPPSRPPPTTTSKPNLPGDDLFNTPK
ncbi:MAG: acyltransferase domain-containing protein [Polyangiaceae bacterium]|nr:acyltransferase domain-containing protein [Polyangiaceae bacterium]